jgi:hypothetical protein
LVLLFPGVLLVESAIVRFVGARVLESFVESRRAPDDAVFRVLVDFPVEIYNLLPPRRTKSRGKQVSLR